MTIRKYTPQIFNRRLSEIILSAAITMLAIVIPVGCSGGSGVVPADSAFEEDITADWDKMISRTLRKNKLEGLSVAVVETGTGAWTAAYGSSGPDSTMGTDTAMYLASVTKTFTSLAVMQLAGEGRVNLDAPIGTYVPEITGHRYPGAPEPTVLDILIHQGGLASDYLKDRIYSGPTSGFPTAYLDTVSDLGNVPMTEEPGLLTHYSNDGYMLLGALIASVSGRPYHIYIREQILEPLGMSDSGFFHPSEVGNRSLGYEEGSWKEVPAMSDIPTGGLWSTADDMAAYLQMLLEGGRDSRGNAVVDRTSLLAMSTPVSRKVPLDFDFRRGTGFDLMPLPGRPAVDLAFHDGGTSPFASTLVMVPEYGIGVVLMSNTDESVPYTLAYEIIHSLLDRREGIPGREAESGYVYGPMAGRNLNPDELSGDYASEIGLLEVSREKDQAIFHMMGTSFRMLPAEGNAWRLQMRLAGLIPINIPGVRLHFREIDGRRVAAYYEDGKFRSIAVAVEPVTVPDRWDDRYGQWLVLDPGPHPFVESLELSFDPDTGYIQSAIKVASFTEALVLPMLPGEGDSLVTAGLGRHMGESLIFREADGQLQIHWAGLILARE